MTKLDIDTMGEMLEEKGLSHSEIDAYFEHAGVKGMKWGVRQQKKLARSERVASGTASLKDKVGFGANQSVVSLVRGKGLKGAAARDASRRQAQKDRIERGEASVKDVLSKYSGVQLVNFGSAK